MSQRIRVLLVLNEHAGADTVFPGGETTTGIGVAEVFHVVVGLVLEMGIKPPVNAEFPT